VKPKSDLPQGTLDSLILKVVALGPIHGYAVAQRLEQVSRGGFALSGVAPGLRTAVF
jgi:DNA-binding PadR family transcriptional regulator